MLSGLSFYAFLAPALVTALPWDGAVETVAVGGAEIAYWGPAPTARPSPLELVKRIGDQPGPNTCGFVLGDELNSLTCLNSNLVCATASQYGVHGCCDPNGLDECYIATTCYPGDELGSAPTNDPFATLCTEVSVASCYEWRYNFGTTTVTEHGCAATGFTSSASRTYDGQPPFTDLSESSVLEVPASTRVVTLAQTRSSDRDSGSATNAPDSKGDDGGDKKNNIGPIVGGVVGGIVAIAAIVAAVVFFSLRKRRANATAAGATPAAHNNPNYEYKPVQDPNQNMSPYPQQAYPQQGYGYPVSPYQQSVSPVPYGQPSPIPQSAQPIVHQLDSTDVGHKTNAEGKPVYEAP